MSVLFIDDSIVSLNNDFIRSDIRFIEDDIFSLDIITFLRHGNIKNLFDYKMHQHNATQYKVIISNHVWKEYRGEIHKLFDYMNTVSHNIAEFYVYEDGKIHRLVIAHEPEDAIKKVRL